jgi:hypothetical protein
MPTVAAQEPQTTAGASRRHHQEHAHRFDFHHGSSSLQRSIQRIKAGIVAGTPGESDRFTSLFGVPVGPRSQVIRGSVFCFVEVLNDLVLNIFVGCFYDLDPCLFVSDGL